MEDHGKIQQTKDALYDLVDLHGAYSVETIDQILENVMQGSDLETATDTLTMAISCYMYHQRTGTQTDLDKSLLFLRELENKISQNIH